MTVQLVLQLTALSHASLEPDGDALGDIKGISTAGQIPYQDTRQNPLFVMEVEVQRPPKRRKKSKKKAAKAPAKG